MDVNNEFDSGLLLNIFTEPLRKKKKLQKSDERIENKVERTICDFSSNTEYKDTSSNKRSFVYNEKNKVESIISDFSSNTNQLKVTNSIKRSSVNDDTNTVESVISDFSSITQIEEDAKSKKIRRSFVSNKKSTSTHDAKTRVSQIGNLQLHSSSLFKCNPRFLPLNLLSTSGRHEPLFSEKLFTDLNLHPHLSSCLKDRLNIVKLTEIQEKTIPILMGKKDALVKSCTGSGKTLTYALPIVQQLQAIRPKITRSDGLFALVIVPTRELAVQCFECFSTLTKAFTWIVPGYLSGGEKMKSEKARIRKGINILISTPGRLIDHLEHTSNLHLDGIKWLVIDEGDRLLEQGFEDTVLKIVTRCSNERQTVLLSATLSKGVENLAGMSLTDPVYLDASSTSEDIELQKLVLPKRLKQYVVTVPSKLRLVSLSAFILDKCVKGNFKALVFMCTQSCVDFHFSLLSSILASLLLDKGLKSKFFRLHGNMKQNERVEIFKAFRKAKEGILFCTDVAARGLDFPLVDWIIQYTAPASVADYVHRVGRTARIGKKGNSLLFILPSENKFSEMLEKQEIQVNEIHMETLLQPILLFGDVIKSDTRKVLSVEDYATALQTKFENTVYSENILYENAKDAFLSYVQSYSSYPKDIRSVLPFKLLHLGHTVKSFCLKETPSKLGCRFAKYGITADNQKTSWLPVKRNQSIVSEFGSGLNEWKNSGLKPHKRKKLKK